MHAVTFFAISILVQAAGFLVYAFVFPKLQAVKSYRLAAQQQGSHTVADELAAAGIQTNLKVSEHCPHLHLKNLTLTS